MKISKYRTYQYTFSHTGDTVQAVIRLYNDMSISAETLQLLVEEFNKINPNALPPHLGQTVSIPVLLSFCYRHENDNKIFEDE